jgi:hypothetical protein
MDVEYKVVNKFYETCTTKGVQVFVKITCFLYRNPSTKM